MLPKLISIDGFFVPAYGVLVASGFLLGLSLAVRLGRRAGLSADRVTSLAVYCALAGIAGGKLLMVALDFDYYRKNPGELFSLATLQSGGVFYGGLLAALATAVLYTRAKRMPGLVTADVFAPGTAAGHALGRLGCFMAGCCWGVECDKPWGVTFTNPDANRMFGTPLGVPLHPTQLYEAGAEAAIFGILYYRSSRSHRPGAVIGLYLVLYSSARLLIEFFRAQDQPRPFGGPLSWTQWLALLVLAGGLALLRRSRRRPAA